MNVLKCSVQTDDITNEISRMFDYKFNGESSFTVPQLPQLPSNFKIGLIVGPSGSGKSSILRQFGDEQIIQWDNNKPIVSHFADAEDAQKKLAAVGFNSVPAWLRPYSVLSNGEKFRADLARSLQSNAVIDEFTSVVDRNVAKSCSNAINRYIHTNNITNVVFASCHYDIIEWLQPDWVYDTATQSFVAGRSERRPSIELEIIPCGYQAWSMFRQHHYLDDKLNKAARCWIAVWNDVPVGFISILPMPSGTLKNAWREHRLVVLPDFQGLGVGVRLSEAIGQLFMSEGKRYFSKTAHPRLGEYREQSSKWKPTSKNKMLRKDYEKYQGNIDSFKYKNHFKHKDRFCYSHEYIGQIQQP